MPSVQPQGKNSIGSHAKDISGSKFKKKKLPVTHAMLNQSSLADQLEKTQAALAAMTSKYNSVVNLSSDARSGGAEAVGLIPKPEGEVGRSGSNAKKKGYHLQTAMGMTTRKDLYNKIRVRFQIEPVYHAYIFSRRVISRTTSDVSAKPSIWTQERLKIKILNI